MMKPTLVVMAAGMGSRFGGCKQMTPVDDAGHVIIDFSIYDAIRAGFGKILCIIKREMEADFRSAIGDRITGHIPLEYVYQELDALPEGFTVPEGRKKPWGTGHAVLCAAEKIEGAFAVINADDFYGLDAFQSARRFLTGVNDPARHAMVGYRVENTLTENGSVSRGVCSVDESGQLTGIIERTHIEPCEGGAAFTEDGGKTFTFIPAGTPVSMNLWAFQHSILKEFRTRFATFLEEQLPVNPERCEYFLPFIPNALLQEKRARVDVLNTDEKWYGVTYRDDLDKVREAIAEMKRNGRYPESLWK